MPLSLQEASPRLRAKMAEMRKTLSPLVSITTGQVHEAFPKTLLHYWLLTHSELDALAAFYHQSTPSRWTNEYPKVMGWREGMGIEEKRRRWGMFMGLRGCETPTRERSVRDWEETMMMQIRKGREEEEMMRRKTQGFY